MRAMPPPGTQRGLASKGCTGGPPAPHTKSSEIPVLVHKEKNFLKPRPYTPRTNIVQILGRGRGSCLVADNSKKPSSKKEKEKKQTHPSPTPQQDGQRQSTVPQSGEATRSQNKNNNNQKKMSRENFGLVTPAAEQCPLWGRRWRHPLCMGGRRSVPFGQSWAPAVRTKGKMNLNSTKLWWPWAVVGRQPLFRSVTLPHQGTASPEEGQRAQAAVLASGLAAEAIGRQGQW